MTDFRAQHSFVLAGVLAELLTMFPNVKLTQDSERTQGKGYYDPVCFWIFVSDDDGHEYNIADGGFTDWTQKLLSNKKERLLISGLGTERLCFLFAPERKA